MNGRMIPGLIATLMILSLVTTVGVSAQSGGNYNLEWNSYAAPSAQGNGDCSSWVNACTLRTALTVAVSGDEIWVKAGVHYPGSERTDTFALISGVAIYGGFAGTETTRDQRNGAPNITIHSGDIDGNDTNSDGNFIAETWNDIQGINAYHVVTGSGTNSSTVLDGFVITAGQANLDHTHFPNDSGGGMYNSGGGPTLVNITFSGNTASYGGAIRNYYGGDPTLTNVVFRGNSAILGGGIFNHNSNPTLTSVTFSGNDASDRGGGIGVRLVIQNQDEASVVDEFWVDLYVNPLPPPDAVNQAWYDGRSRQGIVWGVTNERALTSPLLPLAAGQALTLTFGDAFMDDEYTAIAFPLAPGTLIYAQVDSADARTSYGGVLETHEPRGGAYNNIFGPTTATARSLAATTPVRSGRTCASASLPARPPLKGAQ